MRSDFGICKMFWVGLILCFPQAMSNLRPRKRSQASENERHKDVFRSHYAEIAKVLSLFPEVLLSLSMKFYQHKFIGLETKASIKRLGGLEGAEMLLDHVIVKIEQSNRYMSKAMDILREEVALRDIVQKMDDSINQIAIRRSGYDVSIVPEWCYHGLSSLQYEILPVYRTIKQFRRCKQNDEVLFTDPFYTSNEGYKATLRVDPNGYGSSKGTHVSVFIYLMKGPNDDKLPFPINGIFTVQALNWKEDHHHIEQSIAFDDSIPIEYRERVTRGQRADGFWGDHLISHNDMARSINLLYEDMMCFKISYTPTQTGGSPVPSWCDVSYFTSTIPPCTRTMYSYTAYKNNCNWYSQPFYSAENGYKLRLCFVANGARGTHLSLHVVVVKGDYDDTLSWPFNATITVQLLNCSSDSHHVEKTIPHYTAPIKYRQRVSPDEDDITAPNGQGYNFISHTELQDTSDHTVTYINNDNICFRITSVDIIDK